MDNTAHGFIIRGDNACNYCEEVDIKKNSNKLYHNENDRQKLIEKIKQDGAANNMIVLLGSQVVLIAPGHFT